MLLQNGDFEGLINRLSSARNPSKFLQSLVYDPDEEIKWRAIKAVGLVSRKIADDDIEKLRDIIRRLLWLMNDESGGLGWHSPELIGEILVNVPVLIKEYAQLLVSFFKEEPFEKGSHLAVYRVASVDPKPYVDKTDQLMKSLNKPDKHIQAYTLLALGKIDPTQVKRVEKDFNYDTEKIELFNFETGHMESIDLAQIVTKILDNDKSSIDAA